MRAKLFTMFSLCLLGFASTAYAHEHDRFSFSVNLGNNPPPVIVNPVPVPQPVYIEQHSHMHGGPHWVDVQPGFPVPMNAVIGGYEPNRPDPFYVCHGRFRDGIHPGKLLAGHCNISWGGQEIPLSRYQVLVSRFPLNWVPASNGYVPPNAVLGGYENANRLFICQTRYNGGLHIGKVIGPNCNFGWGGTEITKPYYKVLVG